MRRTTRVRATLLAAVVSIGLASCSTVRVDTDYDPAYDFESLNSYAWLSSPPDHAEDPRLQNTLVDKRVRRAVDNALAAKGYRPVSEDSASFLVNYYLGLETRMDVQTIHHSYGYTYRGWYGAGAAETRVREYEEGTLLVDLLDSRSHQLVWRGSGRARVGRSTTPEESEKKIQDAVTQILKSFPPQAR